MKSLTNHDEPCRVCRGRGFLQNWEWNIHAQQETLQNFTCNLCQGTGLQTIRVVQKGEQI